MPAAPLPQLPPIAVALRGLDPAAAGVAPGGGAGERIRGMIGWLSRAGARAVQVDGTLAGIRPRELDRSGRRDLASLLRRNEMVCAGVDLFIPPEHFATRATADRALASLTGAIDLAADLAALGSGAVAARAVGGFVSTALPADVPVDVRAAIAERAAARGVRVADYTWPIAEALPGDAELIGVGLDPAVVCGAGGDPVALAARLGSRLAGVRLSGVTGLTAAGRAAPGAKRLDVAAYFVTLVTVGYRGHVVIDLAGAKDPAGEIGAACAFRL